MFVQDNLQNPRVFSDEGLPKTKFLLMFVAVVITPLVLFAIGGRTPNTFGQFGLAASLLFFAAIFLLSVGSGMMMLRSYAYAKKAPSIRPTDN